MLKISSSEIRTCISRLADNIRAENIEYESYLKMYSGEENILNIDNKNNTVIYGRRGSGKTHLLKALQENIMNRFSDDKVFPVYIDARRIVPLVPSSESSSEINAILIFKYLMQELSHNLAVNVNTIYDLNPFDSSSSFSRDIWKEEINNLFQGVYLEFDGRTFSKPTSLTVSEEEVKSLSGNGGLSSSPKIEVSGKIERKNSGTREKNSYISILDITNHVENLIGKLGINRLTLIIDEWSEIEIDTQIHLAEILKKSFSAIPVTLKIAAIPNRTNLGIKREQKFFGLEDGGDIFGYQLDMRYVFEVNKTQTRDFFNDLLYKHLYSLNANAINSLLRDHKTNPQKIINLFLANVALNEIFIASAGIPRDFMNLFIGAYDKFIISSNQSAKRIGVKHLRTANSEWYETDKKKQVDKHAVERHLLTEIVREIIENKKSIHFLVPEKYSQNKHIQNLIDFRVMHLRRNGYSHKDHPGVSYNVYSIDYGCYNSLNISKKKLDSSMLDNLQLNDFRDIRRISLEDTFFNRFLINIGEAFSCPHCKQPIDTNHLAYVKQSLCNNCFEKVIQQ